MTYWQLLFFALVWPFIALALFVVFSRALARRDMDAFRRYEAGSRELRIKEAAE
jgi:NADH:ubiquinone oxidoreductase subunit 3 (subunit A)